jgi:hypothetical protein
MALALFRKGFAKLSSGWFIKCVWLAESNFQSQCVFGLSISRAFCQLLKGKSCAIIFSSLQQRLAPVRGLGIDGVRLTKRAADGGYAPRFLGFFLALGLSRFDSESTLPPTAANARR